LPELPRRQIDRHGAGGQSLILPRAQLAAGFAQHPFADRQNKPALLGDRDEFLRTDHAEFGRLPAQQRLPALQSPRQDLHLGLVENHQLIAIEGMLQACLQQHAALDFHRQVAAEHHETVTPRRFCAVQGQVGVAHQNAGGLAIGGIGDDADAGADSQVVVAEIKLTRHGLR